MQKNYRMIDVGGKEATRRKAVAKGSIRVSPTTMQMIVKGESPKGNILSIAEVAGIMAAKHTSYLLPLCHPLILDSVRIWFDLGSEQVEANCEVVCSAKTGVEMEALVGLNICLLTIYDLAKAVDPVIEISDVYLKTKEGGKSGIWTHPKEIKFPTATANSTDLSFQNLKFAVGTLSDRASQGVYQDRSGSILRKFCIERSGLEEFYKVIPDEKEALHGLVMSAAEHKIDVLLLTGGTGISSRDITPDVLKEIASKELPGFGELQRQFGAQFTKASWLSRCSAYVVKDTLVVLFPGSPKAVQQGLDCVGTLIPHAVRVLRGESHHEGPAGVVK